MRSLALALVLAGCAGGPRARAWRPEALGQELARLAEDAVPAPRCFAYSAARRAYACLGWASDNDGADREPGDYGRRAFVDLAGRDVERLLVWADEGEPAVAPAVVDRRLDGGQFAAASIARVPLVAGGWVRAGRLALRYDLDLHEGDASFEYFGDVIVRCPGGGEHALRLRERELELGEVVVLFSAPGARLHALAVAGEDGGEGTYYHTIDTVLLDEDELCRSSDAHVQ